MNILPEPTDIPIGVVGLGLMGSSIVVALATAGHPVTALAPISQDLDQAEAYLRAELDHCADAGLLTAPPDAYFSRITITESYAALGSCQLVIECVAEQIEIKKSVYRQIEQVVPATTLIASNTSALPINQLQSFVTRPERFLGIHWAEPAYMTRFLEITCGTHTGQDPTRWVYDVATRYWQKEPTVLAKDIRGFITNRLMYALYREALHLADLTGISFDDLDKCLKYDAGSWITFMGLLRRIDLLGLNDHHLIARRLFPQLSNTDQIPPVMQRVLAQNFRGTKNGLGLFHYENGDASRWENAFAQYNKDIYAIARKYPYNAVQARLATQTGTLPTPRRAAHAGVTRSGAAGRVLVVGNNPLLVGSVAVWLAQQHVGVSIWTDSPAAVSRQIDEEVRHTPEPALRSAAPTFVTGPDTLGEYELAIVLTDEDLPTKQHWIALAEQHLVPTALIACNTESFDLDQLTRQARFPERILGANWSYPVPRTFFLEIISGRQTDPACTAQLEQTARQYWRKDPYVVAGGFGVRARLLCAILREGFYLIEHGYAQVEDIDRALRNDAGFYLSFAGNFRYMDLMGLYSYGVVMGELNPTLSTAATTPEFFDRLVERGHAGMESGHGFYPYSEAEVAAWKHLFGRFSTEMEALIHKYS